MRSSGVCAQSLPKEGPPRTYTGSHKHTHSHTCPAILKDVTLMGPLVPKNHVASGDENGTTQEGSVMEGLSGPI